MPPKVKFTKEVIIDTATDLIREKGMDALTARGLAERLGCSVKPIFGLFKNMAEVQAEVISNAKKIYGEYLKKEMNSGEYPPYKGSGMGYIKFAREEKELFKLLYMRDRSGENISGEEKDIQGILAIIQKNLGLSHEQAFKFHMEMWIYVHGIATMIATNYLKWETQTVSDMISDVYKGLTLKFSDDSGRIND